MEKGQIVELVVYKVKSEKIGDKELIVDGLNKAIQQFDGFNERTVHQSSEDPSIYMDYVTWDSLEQAQKAAKSLESIPEIMPFLQAIEEVKSFTHFEKR